VSAGCVVVSFFVALPLTPAAMPVTFCTMPFFTGAFLVTTVAAELVLAALTVLSCTGLSVATRPLTGALRVRGAAAALLAARALAGGGAMALVGESRGRPGLTGELGMARELFVLGERTVEGSILREGLLAVWPAVAPGRRARFLGLERSLVAWFSLSELVISSLSTLDTRVGREDAALPCALHSSGTGGAWIILGRYRRTAIGEASCGSGFGEDWNIGKFALFFERFGIFVY